MRQLAQLFPRGGKYRTGFNVFLFLCQGVFIYLGMSQNEIFLNLVIISSGMLPKADFAALE